MGALRSPTVNLCGEDESLWQVEGAGGGSFHKPGMGAGSGFTLTVHGGGRWRCAPRHVEPDREYVLECDVRGRGRIGLVWVREGRPLQETAEPARRQVWTTPDGTPQFAELAEVDAVWSEEVAAEEWRRVAVSGVSPRTANRVQVVLESVVEAETAFDSPYFDGLGAAPVEIMLPAGYEPGSSKVAAITVRETAVGGSFEVVSGDGVVFSGELRRWGEYIWGREHWEADFSEVREPGRYRLRVAFEEGREALSPEFRIEPELYLTLANMTLGWFNTQRCGVEVPGWHKACHLDDALLGESRNRPLGPGGEWTITGETDLTGGWHDAGDNHKYICWCYVALWAMARLQGIQRMERRELGEALPDPLAEAAWEARFVLKTMSPEGLFPFGVVSRFGWVNVPVHEETDNVRGTGDERALPPPEERICDIPTFGPVFTSALVASALADLGVALRGGDDGLATACMEAALTTWRHHHREEAPDDEYLRWQAAFALLGASLYRAEGREEFRRDLEERVGRIAAQQKPEGVFPFPKECDDYREQVLGVGREERARLPYLSPAGAPYAVSHEACGIDYIPAPFTYLHALLDYLELFPEGAQAGAARRALSRAMDLAVSLTERTPFGQMMEWTFAPDPMNFVHLFHGYDCALLSLATAACRAAGELGRPELLGVAERQVQWVLGRNPRGTSLVCGVGEKQLGIYHTGLSFTDAHRRGEQPGGVVNGFVSMGAPRPTYSGPSYPWDFPYLDIRSASEEAGWRGADADWWTNETWVPNCSWFMLAAVALGRALGAEDGP
ncbi:MAG TPA: glycoside hydrolase family 9 protein [Armatimonadota bacterium]|nr:glycoside hydrolase family 9 protein [Armatimonadota bacterium]